MNGFNVDDIRFIVPPAFRKVGSFSYYVMTGENVFDVVLQSRLVSRCNQRIIVRQLNIHHSRFEKRKLYVPDLFPVEHQRV